MSSKSGSVLGLNPALRIALGLVILTACLLISADLILGVVPNEASASFTVHRRTSENLAIPIGAARGASRL